MDNKNTKLTNEEIKHIAKLAKLELTDAEIEKFHPQLSEILDYIDLLKNVDTSTVSPLAQITSLTNIARTDETKQSLSSGDAVSQTKETVKGMFKVKAVFKNR